MRPEWVIVNWLDRDQYEFWSDDGWTDFENANTYTMDDVSNLSLPLEGAWVMKGFARHLLVRKEGN